MLLGFAGEHIDIPHGQYDLNTSSGVSGGFKFPFFDGLMAAIEEHCKRRMLMSGQIKEWVSTGKESDRTAYKIAKNLIDSILQGKASLIKGFGYVYFETTKLDESDDDTNEDSANEDRPCEFHNPSRTGHLTVTIHGDGSMTFSKQKKSVEIVAKECDESARDLLDNHTYSMCRKGYKHDGNCTLNPRQDRYAKHLTVAR